MVERPILFSAPMVRALLEGRKTQTRRIIKPRPYNPEGDRVNIDAASSASYIRGADGRMYFQFDHPGGGPLTGIVSRFNVGDRLWVKEAWGQEHPLAIQDGRFSLPGQAGIPGPPGVSYRVIYRVDGEPLQIWRQDAWPYFTLSGPRDEIDAKYPEVCSNYGRTKGIGWDNAMFMPRWASRLTLHPVDVRVERLHEISEDDAIAEGLDRDCADGCCWRNPADPSLQSYPSAVEAYAALWMSIHGSSSWATDPWVAVTAFKLEHREMPHA